MDNQSLSHTKRKCQYHIVFIPKYRRKKIYGKIQSDVREILRTLCEYKQVKITAGAVMRDQVHLCIGMPPKYGENLHPQVCPFDCVLALIDLSPMSHGQGKDYQLVIVNVSNNSIITYPVSPLSASVCC